MKEALKKTANLINRFERNIEAYHSSVYNETQLRIGFKGKSLIWALEPGAISSLGFRQKFSSVLAICPEVKIS